MITTRISICNQSSSLHGIFSILSTTMILERISRRSISRQLHNAYQATALHTISMSPKPYAYNNNQHHDLLEYTHCISIFLLDPHTAGFLFASKEYFAVLDNLAKCRSAIVVIQYNLIELRDIISRLVVAVNKECWALLQSL
jgi:hypothetical protein